MNRLIIRRISLIVITVIWMGVIFSFSAEPAEESTSTSDAVVDKICSVVVNDYKSLDEASRRETIGNYSLLVRKCAHFTSYLVLGILVYSTFIAFDVRGKKTFPYSLAACALYAVSDEAHQYFVPGRACRLLDVLIDSSGAVVGIGFACLFLLFIAGKSKDKRVRKSSRGKAENI